MWRRTNAAYRNLCTTNFFKDVTTKNIKKNLKTEMRQNISLPKSNLAIS